MSACSESVAREAEYLCRRVEFEVKRQPQRPTIHDSLSIAQAVAGDLPGVDVASIMARSLEGADESAESDAEIEASDAGDDAAEVDANAEPSEADLATLRTLIPRIRKVAVDKDKLVAVPEAGDLPVDEPGSKQFPYPPPEGKHFNEHCLKLKKVLNRKTTVTWSVQRSPMSTV